jgi:hypothetical protein
MSTDLKFVQQVKGAAVSDEQELQHLPGRQVQARPGLGQVKQNGQGLGQVVQALVQLQPLEPAPRFSHHLDILEALVIPGVDFNNQFWRKLAFNFAQKCPLSTCFEINSQLIFCRQFCINYCPRL